MPATKTITTIIVLLCWGARSRALMQPIDEFLDTYSSLKVNHACLSPAAVGVWRQRTEDAMAECEQQQMLPKFTPVPVVISLHDWTKIFNQFYSQAYRQKRGAVFSSEKIKKIQGKVTKKVRYFRCLMQKMNVTDVNNELTPAAYLAGFSDISLSRSLHTDIADGIHECNKVAECRPLSKGNPLPIPSDVIRTSAFLGCEKRKRQLACLVEELRGREEAFDYSSAPGWMLQIPRPEERAALLLYAQQVFGNDDYGLLE